MRNKAVKILTTVMLCCIFGLGIVACDKGGYKFPDYTYTNPDRTETPDLDEGIVLDGDVGEEFWSGRWFSSSLEGQDNITLAMTSRIGDKGVYFAFEVEDDSVYATEERDAFKNSGIELYVSTSDGGDTLNNATSAFEIDVNANAMTRISKWTSRTASYTGWPAKFYCAVKTQGGAVNTGECEGYTIEMFLPYLMLGLEEKPEFLYVNPTLIRSLAPDKEADRLWYNFGIHERNADWSIARTWYTFDDGGLVANNVEKNVSAGGQVICKDYVVEGDNLTLELKPDEGCIATAVRINGKDMLNSFGVKNGKTVYTMEMVEGDVRIDAEFAELAPTRTVTGKLNADPLPPNENYAVFTLYAAGSGYYKELSVKADGTFSAELPANDLYIYAEAEEYMTARAAVKAEQNTAQLSLRPAYLGNNENVGFSSYDASKWDMSLLGEGTARSLTTDIPNSAVHSEIFSDRIFVSGSVLMPKHPSRDRRAGFGFYTPSGDCAFISIAWMIEGGQNRYEGNMITNTDRWDNPAFGVSTVAGSEEMLAGPEGVPYSVLYHDGLFDIWVNGVKVSENVEFKKDGVNMFKDGDTVLKAAVGIQTWAYGAGFKDLVFLSGEEAEPAGAPYRVIANASAGGSVKTDKDTYQPGDDIKVTVLPDKGYSVNSISVNGIDYFPMTANNTFTVENWDRTMLIVKVEFLPASDSSYAFGGNITQYKDGKTAAAEGAVITIKDTAAFEKSATVGADGSYDFGALPAGVYNVSVRKDGFVLQTETIELREDTVADFHLVWNFAGDSFGGIDLSHMNDADHKITISSWGGARIVTGGLSDSYRVTFTLKANEWCGGWNDNFGIRVTENRGFSFLFGDDGSKGIKLQWGGAGEGIAETAAMPDWVDAAIWGEGLEVMVIRDGAYAYLYALCEGEWQYLHKLAIDPAKAEPQIWVEQWGKSTYTDISVTDGAYPLAIVKNETQNGSFTVNSPMFGEDVTISVLPDDGYVLKGLSVNGVPSTELGGSFDESGTVFTVKNWRGALKLEISVTFEKLRTADVEFNLNLHSYRLNGGVPSAAADGTEVMLVGTREYSAEVSGGKVKISGVVEGEYLLKAEGYKPITLAVGEGLADSYMLEYDAIGENAGFDTSKINDGTVKVVTNTWPGDIYLKDSVPANTDFLISALVRHLGEGDIRYGFTAGADLNNDGAYSDAADENIEFIQATLHQSGSVVELSVCNYWVGVNLNDAQLAKFRGEGLRIGFGRIDGKFYMFFDNGGAGMSQALAIPTSNGMTTAELRLGLRAWDNTLNAEYSGLRLEIGEITSVIFADGVEGIDRVTDQDNNDKLIIDADVSKIGEGTVTWDTATREAIWTDYATAGDFTYEATVKGVFNSDFRLSPFLLRYGDNYADIIAFDITPAQIQIYERWWDNPSYGGAGVDLTEAQKAAVQGDGLKIKVVREGDGFYFYADTCAGTEPEWQLLDGRKIVVVPGVGEVRVGVGIMDTTGTVSDIRFTEN